MIVGSGDDEIRVICILDDDVAFVLRSHVRRCDYVCSWSYARSLHNTGRYGGKHNTGRYGDYSFTIKPHAGTKRAVTVERIAHNAWYKCCPRKYTPCVEKSISWVEKLHGKVTLHLIHIGLRVLWNWTLSFLSTEKQTAQYKIMKLWCSCSFCNSRNMRCFMHKTTQSSWRMGEPE